MREKSLCVPSKHLPARDCDLLHCERFDSDRGVSISCSASNVTVAPKSDRCERVGWPLAGPRVQNGHFLPGKATAINSHPAPALSGGCSVVDSEKIIEQPTLRRFEFKIHRDKTPE